MSKATVIIPIQKETNRVDELIGALLFQSEEDIEIICVVNADNGCVPLIKNYTKYDKRVKMISAVSHRNCFFAAVEKAASPYILLLRPDSFANTPYVAKLLQVATDSAADFVYAPLVRRDEISHKFRPLSALTVNDFSIKNLDGRFTPDAMAPSFLEKSDRQIYGKLIKTDFFKEILQDSSSQTDETTLFERCLQKAKNIAYTLSEMIFEWENIDTYLPSFWQATDESTKISVIVPVYNVNPDFLRRCLDSLVFQTYKNLEIVCVDDESKDGSLQILQEYAAKDARFKVITQKNGGVSAARNTGIAAATGDYITFMDDDDSVSLALYQKFTAILAHEKKPIDLFEFNGLYAFSQNVKLSTIPMIVFVDDWGDFSNGHFKDFKDNFNIEQGAIWNKIYRAEWLKNEHLTFPVGMLFEDNIFSVAAFLCAKSIYFAENYLYFYRQLATSQIHNLKHKVFDTFKMTDMLQGFFEKNGCFEQVKWKFFDILAPSYWILISECPSEELPQFLQTAREYLGRFSPIPPEVVAQCRYTEYYNAIMNWNIEEIKKRLNLD